MCSTRVSPFFAAEPRRRPLSRNFRSTDFGRVQDTGGGVPAIASKCCATRHGISHASQDRHEGPAPALRLTTRFVGGAPHARHTHAPTLAPSRHDTPGGPHRSNTPHTPHRASTTQRPLDTRLRRPRPATPSPPLALFRREPLMRIRAMRGAARARVRRAPLTPVPKYVAATDYVMIATRRRVPLPPPPPPAAAARPRGVRKPCERSRIA